MSLCVGFQKTILARLVTSAPVASANLPPRFRELPRAFAETAVLPRTFRLASADVCNGPQLVTFDEIVYRGGFFKHDMCWNQAIVFLAQPMPQGPSSPDVQSVGSPMLSFEQVHVHSCFSIYHNVMFAVIRALCVC
jgi:hypothetical protein